MKQSEIAVLVIALLLMLLATTSRADDESGWAFNVGIGASLIKDRDGNESFQGNGFGYNLGTEYRFGPRWALGIDFFSLGSGSDTINSVDTTIDVGGFDIRGRMIFPVSDAVEFFGRLGYAGYFADVTPGGSNLGEEAVSLGLGLDIGRSKNAVFRIEGRYFQGPRDESGALLAAGVNLRF